MKVVDLRAVNKDNHLLETPEGFDDLVGDTVKIIGQSAGNY
jgi:hypothetical protein